MENNFSPKILSLLLDVAKGPRSWRQFAIDCDVSYVQMRKLASGEQQNPPRPKLIKKIADHSFGEIDFEDFLFASGLSASEKTVVTRRNDANDFLSKYRALPQKDKNTVNSFIDFLYFENIKGKEQPK